MGIEATHDLFVYELGLMREVENTGISLLELLKHRVSNNDLRDLIHQEQNECRNRQENIDACLRAYGAQPVATQSEAVNGLHRGFEDFLRMRPVPDIIDQFAVDTAIRFLYLGITGHTTLIDWAILMGESQCISHLHDNLIRKQQSAANLERFSHELGARLLAASGKHLAA